MNVCRPSTKYWYIDRPESTIYDYRYFSANHGEIDDEKYL